MAVSSRFPVITSLFAPEHPVSRPIPAPLESDKRVAVSSLRMVFSSFLRESALWKRQAAGGVADLRCQTDLYATVF